MSEGDVSPHRREALALRVRALETEVAAARAAVAERRGEREATHRSMPYQLGRVIHLAIGLALIAAIALVLYLV